MKIERFWLLMIMVVSIQILTAMNIDQLQKRKADQQISIDKEQALNTRNHSLEIILSTLRTTRKEKVEHVYPYIFPIHKDDYVELTSPFGYREIYNPMTGGDRESNHLGIDAVGTWKARVVAIADGEIIDKWYPPDGKNRKGHPVFGGYIRILHKDGYISGYGHLSVAYVKEGDWVEQGQVIARTGNTGISFGEHIHNSIEDPNGNLVNPLKYIDFKGE